MPAPTLILTDDDRLRITLRRGTSGRAIVSFSGVGLGLGGVPQEEFSRALADGDHDQYFVIDKERSWYNRTAGQILAVLARRLADHDSVLTIGNSMGGFGAIHFAGLFPRCNAAVAFAPQFSVKPELVAESRWRSYIRQIKSWPVPHALTAPHPDVRYYVLFGENADQAHAAQFEALAPDTMDILYLHGCGHDVVRRVRDMGVLPAIVEAAASGGMSPSVRSILAA